MMGAVATIRTDASPFGMGGVLLSARHQPLCYWADALGPLDFERFGAKLGDPAWQAEWEHLAVLTSLHAFRGHLPRRSCIAIEGTIQRCLRRP